MLGLHWMRRLVVGIGAGWGERPRGGERPREREKGREREGVGLKRDADWRREG